jgi:hypothetical protein
MEECVLKMTLIFTALEQEILYTLYVILSRSLFYHWTKNLKDFPIKDIRFRHFWNQQISFTLNPERRSCHVKSLCAAKWFQSAISRGHHLYIGLWQQSHNLQLGHMYGLYKIRNCWRKSVSWVPEKAEFIIFLLSCRGVVTQLSQLCPLGPGLVPGFLLWTWTLGA